MFNAIKDLLNIQSNIGLITHFQLPFPMIHFCYWIPGQDIRINKNSDNILAAKICQLKLTPGKKIVTIRLLLL